MNSSEAQETRPCAPATPGAEHLRLKSFEGTWDAAVKSWMEPGAPPMESKGVETVSLLGGFWLLCDFQSEMMGRPYRGHGMRGYDQARKKYVSTWADSMSGQLMIFEGDYDEATKTFTMTAEGPGFDGKPTKWTSVHAAKDADRNVFTLAAAGPGGQHFVCMEITYTRRP